MDQITIMILLTGFCITVGGTLMYAENYLRNKFEAEAVDAGHAQFNPKTKKFEWKKINEN